MWTTEALNLASETTEMKKNVMDLLIYFFYSINVISMEIIVLNYW